MAEEPIHTWEELIGGLGTASGQIVHHLLRSGVPPDWSQEPEEFRNLVLPSMEGLHSALLLRLSLSDEDPYFLSDSDLA